MSVDGVEQELVVAAVSGNRTALERLFLDHYDQLSRHIGPNMSASLRGTLSVEDILQQAFVQAARNIDRFKPTANGSFCAWLKVIAENQLLDAVKALKRKKRGGGRHRVRCPGEGQSSSVDDLIELMSDGRDSPSRVIARRQAVHAIKDAMDGLPSDQCEAIRLHYFDRKTMPEIAVVMDRTPAAIRGLMHRAKRALRDTLGGSSRWLSKK